MRASSPILASSFRLTDRKEVLPCAKESGIASNRHEGQALAVADLSLCTAPMSVMMTCAQSSHTTAFDLRCGDIELGEWPAGRG